MKEIEDPPPVASVTLLANVTEQKPKNVPEELRIFLETNPDEWFTNEQLAERLNQ